MSDIRTWLADLGLDQYVGSFEENAIGLEHLCDLDADALKELGVKAMGHRLTFLKAAAQYGQQESITSPVPDRTTETHLNEPERTDAERRQITVLFCDLVGSTSLSDQLDPEDLRALLQAYQELCGQVVDRYSGHVAQYLGDGLMVYFGWPRAHEDDAGRAIRSAIDIVAALKSSEKTAELQVRIGIATGPVVVGDTGDGDASVPKAAVGETPNLAARCQAKASAGEIVVGPTTHRLAGGAFDYDDLGKHELKGIVESVHIWRVTGESRAESRFEASNAAGLTPLVGREHEIGLLLERWQQAKEGEGQVVLLSGEPGIGKSRITQVLRERIADDPQTRLRYQCSPHHSASAFHPIIEQIGRAAEFERSDSSDVKLDKLEFLLRQSGTDESVQTPLFAALMSLQLDRYAPQQMSPQKQKDATIAAFVKQTIALSRQKPVLMIFEDVHWIDPSSLEALSAFVDQLQNANVMLVITHRPDFVPPWTGYGHITAHTLNRLTRRQGGELAAEITGGKPLPSEVLEQIVAKTDGVPLFVEELTKTVLEANFLTETKDAYILEGPLPPLAIPTTLQDSLMARLDHLSPVKETAQIGAVIGREFTFELLAKVAPQKDNENLAEDLAQLVDSELVFRRGDLPNAVFTFKNVMVQEVAYKSLLNSKRQTLHAKIGETLRTDFPAIEHSQPEVVAHHFTEAGLPDQAIDYWLQAGRRAMKHSANKEAVAHLENGLAAVKDLPDSEAKTRMEIAANLALGTALIGDRGLVEPVNAVFERARTLSDQVGSPNERFVATWGLWHFYNVRGAYDAAIGLADELMGLAAGGQDKSGLILQAHHASWTTNLVCGNFATTKEHTAHGAAVYDVKTHQEHRINYGGHDPGVCGRVFGGLANWLLGYPDKAVRSAEEAAQMARRLDHPMSLAQALTYGNWVSIFRREHNRVRNNAEEAIRIATENGIAMFIGRGQIALAWANTGEGDSETRNAQIRDGLDACKETGSRMGESFYSLLLGEVLLDAGQNDKARIALEQAKDVVESTNERWMEAEIYRLEGDIILRDSSRSVSEAEASYENALRVARAQQARSLELRASTSLARLWRDQSESHRATELLSPIYNWFTEGFDSADLGEAKALLDELA